jgi:hypothetical protein
MFQPRVKLEFVRRYCHPENGWRVCVDIDPSEEGRTGSKRESAESKLRQAAMQADAPRVRESLHAIGANVGDRKHWCESSNLPYLEGDPDIVAYDPQKTVHRCGSRGRVIRSAGAKAIQGNWSNRAHGEQPAERLARPPCDRGIWRKNRQPPSKSTCARQA